MFMKVLERERVCEVGKPLNDLLQKEVGESQYLLDRKTVLRMIGYLEGEARIRVFRVASPNTRSPLRMFVALPDVRSDDPLIAGCLERTLNIESSIGLPEDTIDLDQKTSILPVNSCDQKASGSLRHIPHIYGILARTRKLHVWLLRFSFNSSSSEDASDKNPHQTLTFDTIQAFAFPHRAGGLPRCGLGGAP
jgi:hypothetical protein